MTYNFKEISTTKFSLNGREMYKTFIPIFVDDTRIVVYNIYDSNLRLVPVENVENFTINNKTYKNSTELINNLHSVIFSPIINGADVDLTSIIKDIANLKTGKSEIGHNHDDRYYTETEIDRKLTNISDKQTIHSGQLDYDKMKFFDDKNQQIFQIDVRRLADQGTSITFENGKLLLKNNYGETLSASTIQAEGGYYDKFIFADNISEDLKFVQTNNFQLIKTQSDKYYFFSNEDINNSKIYFNDIDKFFYLSNANKLKKKNAWLIDIRESHYYVGIEYNFNIWRNYDISTFGKVDSINNIKPDSNKNISIKTSDIENDSNYVTTNSLNKKLDKPSKESTTKDYPFVLGLNDKNETAKLPAGDLGKNFANSDTITSENHKHIGTGKQEFAMPLIFSNPSQQFKGLLDKKQDATFTNLIGSDNNGNLAKVGLHALTDILSKSTDTQKEAFRQASLKSSEGYSIGQPRVDMVYPPLIQREDSIVTITAIGLNLFLNNTPSGKAIVNLINVSTQEKRPITNIEVNQLNPSVISFRENLKDLAFGDYHLEVIHNGIKNIDSNKFTLVESLKSSELPKLTWKSLVVQDNKPIDSKIVSLQANGVSFLERVNEDKNNLKTYIIQSNKISEFSSGDFYLEIDVTLPYQWASNRGGNHSTEYMGLAPYSEEINTSTVYNAGVALLVGSGYSAVLGSRSKDLGNIDPSGTLYIVKKNNEVNIGIIGKSINTVNAWVDSDIMLKIMIMNDYAISRPVLTSLLIKKFIKF